MRLSLFAVAAAAALLAATPAYAHCDGLDGPVVAAAREALSTGDANRVLIWVQPAEEAEIRRAFAETLEVRKLGGAAREMADRYFFETLVRLHRAGEGAPYTGLKPAGRDLGPVIPLADQAVASGSDARLAEFLSAAAGEGIHRRFAELQEKRGFAPDDLAAGRAYIARYVAFVHYVAGIHAAVEADAAGHYAEGEPAPAEHHD